MRSIPVVFVALLCLSAGCEDDTPSDPQGQTVPDATLTVHLTVGDYAPAPRPAGPAKTTHTVDIVDIYHTIHSMYVSTGTVAEGQPDDLDWVPLLVDGVEEYDSNLDIQVVVPPGRYTCMKLLQSNALKWVCTDGTETYELQDWNAGSDGPDQMWNVFSTEGLYTYTGDGRFVLQNTGERIGTAFEVLAGDDTVVTIRSNFNTLDWSDADDSGDWSTGDTLGNWTTIPGTDTMVDFIVVNPE